MTHFIFPFVAFASLVPPKRTPTIATKKVKFLVLPVFASSKSYERILIKFCGRVWHG